VRDNKSVNQLSDVPLVRQEHSESNADPGTHVVGVDIGGTFTDFVFRESASGAESYLKLPTDHEHLEQPVIEGMRAFSAAAAGDIEFADVSP
jgi:predicted NBD/HSP70 family sugar kinase